GGQLTSDGRVAIHVSHRLGAVLVLGYLAILLVLLWRQRAQSGLDRAIALAGGALVIQFCLGLTNVWLHIPLMIAVAHNAMGEGLSVSLVHLSCQHLQLARPALSPTR